MVNPTNALRTAGISRLVIALCLSLGVLVGSSPAGAEEEAKRAPERVEAGTALTVERDGEDSVVRVVRLGYPVQSVQTSQEGSVAIIDVVGEDGVDVGAALNAARQVAAYDGVVELVTASTHQTEGVPRTRIEIVMTSGGLALASAAEDGVEIRVIAAEAETFEAANVATVVGGSTEPVSTDVEPVRTVATLLTGVRTHVTAEGVLIGLETNGSIAAVEAFTVEDPARLVVDLPGLVAGPEVRGTRVASAHVRRVRVGVHEEKVRVVLDGNEAAGDFSDRRVMPGESGLWIAVGSGEDLDDAMQTALSAGAAEQVTVGATAGLPTGASEVDPTVHEPLDQAIPETPRFVERPLAAAVPAETESWADQAVVPESVPAAVDPAAEAAATGSVASVPEPAATEPAKGMATLPAAGVATPAEESTPVALSPAQTPASVEIYGLHYERVDGVDRTAILADESVMYSTSAPDATTWVVRLPHAQISEAASDRIFPKAGGPVSLIHAFQQPEVDVPEVRVVFTRAAGQKPTIQRRGSMLFVEFDDQGVAAAPPPAFADFDEVEMAPEVAIAPESIPSVDPATGASQPAAPAPPVPSAYDVDPMMGALAQPESTWVGARSPAAVEVPAAIEVLEEGGLIDGKAYRGRRVSLDFKDVAITDVLRLIAEVSDLNIIAGDEVSGDVTIRLVEVPWDQALDVILMTKGLGFVRVGNVLRIAPSDVLKAEEEVRLQERRNKEKLEDLEVKLLPVNYASVRDTEGLVKRLLTARGTVNLDERTNTLIIKDIGSVIDEASALIAAIDTQTPQVMIEAKIVEANLDFSRELGSTWGVQTQQFVDPFDPDTPRRDLGSEDLTWIGDNSLAFANPITAVPTGLMSVGALILDQDFRVDAQIQAAESTGDGKVVSSPRIVTLDNKEAKIEQGVSIPFQTFEGGDAKLEFIDAVLSLVVTPHITADQSIIMEILVTRNAPDGTIPTPTGSPAIARNVAETETLVKDGQTLVLGGIYTINKSKTQSRVPYLHRIPVIGNAFKSNRVKDSRAELLVFVTPRIVRLPEMASN